MAKRTCPIDGCAELAEDVCHFPTCDRAIATRTRCVGHYAQWRPGRTLRPPRQFNRDCVGPDCRRRARSHGLCESHARQRDCGQELLPLRPYKPGGVHTALIRDGEGRKRCGGGCASWKDESEFYRSSRERDGLVGTCIACHNAGQRTAKILRLYGMSVEAYDALLERQGGVCAICQQVD